MSTIAKHYCQFYILGILDSLVYEMVRVAKMVNGNMAMLVRKNTIS